MLRRALRRRTVVHAGVLALIAVLCTAGILLYFNERDTRQVERVLGERESAVPIWFDVSGQRVDPTARELTVAIVPELTDRMRSEENDLGPKRRLVITTSAAERPEFVLPAHKPIGTQWMVFPVRRGTVTDYPFDRYQLRFGIMAEDGDRRLPVRVKFRETDPFFQVHVKNVRIDNKILIMQAEVSRSRSTLILAWFMMIAMWAIALAVLGGAWVVVGKSDGVNWSALSWMATSLFALVAFRNAAPGTPPIGSVIDYAAFFWAEGIIAACVVYVVLSGIWQEHGQLEQEAETTEPVTASGPPPPPSDGPTA
ncbi:DUF4436 family protein [Streptomyces sp. A7024]|uniref:DUF4436 family protein n=1 Tax=Streptomyces coryli TaxID=1128680 RepID=A0A6G4TQV3_9ACTN|nr:DUF4436 family protein [Streptomyces coryli]NGN62389.1 DUF4436 family protein [Streptomyces coryli]